MPDEVTVGGLMNHSLSMDMLDRVTALMIREAARGNDPEGAHIDADEILVGLLEEIGFKETAKAFEEVPKWYA